MCNLAHACNQRATCIIQQYIIAAIGSCSVFNWPLPSGMAVRFYSCWWHRPSVPGVLIRLRERSRRCGKRKWTFMRDLHVQRSMISCDCHLIVTWLSHDCHMACEHAITHYWCAHVCVCVRARVCVCVCVCMCCVLLTWGKRKSFFWLGVGIGVSDWGRVISYTNREDTIKQAERTKLIGNLHTHTCTTHENQVTEISH